MVNERMVPLLPCASLLRAPCGVRLGHDPGPDLSGDSMDLKSDAEDLI